MGRRIKASLFAFESFDTVWIAGLGRGVTTSGNEGSRLAGLATGTGSSVVDQKPVFVWEKAGLALTQLVKLLKGASRPSIQSFALTQLAKLKVRLGL